MKALLVCDAPWVRNQVGAALSGFYEIVELDDPTQVESRSFSEDLAVVDMQVGSMGGMAIIRALKSAGPEPGPIVLLLDRKADVFLARRAGADAWLTKPFNAQQLRAVLASVVPDGAEI